MSETLSREGKLSFAGQTELSMQTLKPFKKIAYEVLEAGTMNKATVLPDVADVNTINFHLSVVLQSCRSQQVVDSTVVSRNRSAAYLSVFVW